MTNDKFGNIYRKTVPHAKMLKQMCFPPNVTERNKSFVLLPVMSHVETACPLMKSPSLGCRGESRRIWGHQSGGGGRREDLAVSEVETTDAVIRVPSFLFRSRIS